MMTDFPTTTHRERRGLPKARITGNLHKERELKGILIVWRESFRWGDDFLAGRTGVAAMCHVQDSFVQ